MLEKRKPICSSNLILLIFLGIITSCLSPTQENEESPVVNLSINKSTLNLGDTLKVNLHASSQGLISGILDFDDGTVLNFKDKNNIFDTNVTHVYSRFKKVNVKATFNNGKKSTSVIIPVETNNYFAFSFSIGMAWKYSYLYHYSYGPSPEPPILLNGIHKWKIISSTVVNQDTNFTVEHITYETRIIKGDYYGKHIDTTYTIKDTSKILIVLTRGNATFNIPLLDKVQTHVVPNHVLVNSYPVYIPNWSYGDGRGGAYYGSQGLIKYEYNVQGSHGYSSQETLTLLEFIKN